MADDGNNNDGGTGDGGNANDGNANDGKTFSQADIDRVVADRIARERAKFADYADLKKFKQSAMSDAEKAVADAKAAGRAEALATTGGRLARAEFRAAAAGKVETSALDGFLEYADLSKFVREDGEPDDKAITAAVKKLAGPDRGTDFDGGARTTGAKPADMNALIRRSAGFGG